MGHHGILPTTAGRAKKGLLANAFLKKHLEDGHEISVSISLGHHAWICGQTLLWYVFDLFFWKGLALKSVDLE